MKKRFSVLLVVVLFIALFSMSIMAQEELRRLPREETFYVNGLQWGSPSTWNPLAGQPDWPIDYGNARQLLYETLFAYNMLNNELEPQLATEYEWVDDFALEVSLDEKACFHDKEPVTADDVVYTFEFGERYSVTYSDIWQHLNSVEKINDTTVRFNLDPENANRLVLLHHLGFTYILPEHIFSKVEEENDNNITEIRKWTNEEPVGSGPYRLRDYSNERIVLERVDDYWGIENWGIPAPRYVVHPIYKSNDAGNRAFREGNIDISQQFIPQVWEMWLMDDLPIRTWYDDDPYYMPSGMPSLIINHTKEPMNDLSFREALAHAIDYEKIAQLAMTRYSETMKSGFILPKEVDYFDEEDIAEFGWEYNPEKAEEILQSNGYSKGNDGMYRGKDGEKLGPFTVQCPYGWTDWMVSLKIVAQSAREIGIDIRTEFPEAPVWEERLQHGDFDFIMNTPVGASSPAQPWLRFRDAIYSVNVPEPGQMSFKNWGRYKNERVDELIKNIPAMTEDEDRIAAYKELNKIFMQEIPNIPLEYRPWVFHTWSEEYWTNFPDEDNPYAPPQIAQDGAGIRTLFNIEPVE